MNITIKGLDGVLAKLQRYENLDEPMNRANEELMQMATSIVENSYASQGIGNEDYTVTAEHTEHGFKIIATGEDVGFLEFGAGVLTEPNNEFVSEVPFPVYEGSWSETHSGIFAKNKFWFYAGSPYTGRPATRGMQRALDYIRNNALDTYKRYINEWTNAS